MVGLVAAQTCNVTMMTLDGRAWLKQHLSGCMPRYSLSGWKSWTPTRSDPPVIQVKSTMRFVRILLTDTYIAD